MTLHTFNPGVDADTGTAKYDYVSPGPATETLSTTELMCSDNDRYNDATEIITRSGFVRFPMTGISQGTQITAAQLKLTILVAQSALNSDIKIRATDEDVPTAPTTYAQYTGKTLTTAQTIASKLDDHPPAGSVGDDYYFDVKDVLQEVIDRPSWDGSAVVLFLEPNTQFNNTVTTVEQDFEETVAHADEPELFVLVESMVNLDNEIQRFEPQFDIKNGSYLLTDFSTNANTATMWGAAFEVDESLDAVGFDGTDDYVTITDVLEGKTQFSLAYWVEFDSVAGEHPNYTKGGLWDSGGSYSFGTSDADYDYSIAADFGETYPELVSVGVWTHFAIVYDSVGSVIKFYQDGTEVFPDSGLGDPLTVPSSAAIAYLGKGGTQHFDGRLGSVRVFSDLLTAEEVTALSSVRGYNMNPGDRHGDLNVTLDAVTLASDAEVDIEGTLSETLDVITLTSAVAREREGDFSSEITIGFTGTIAGTGSGSADDLNLVLTFAAEGSSVRLGSADMEVPISLTSDGKTANEGDLSVTLDDIFTVANNFSADLSITLEDIVLASYGGKTTTGTSQTVITVSLSSAAHPPILGSLTETLDDVILLQAHNFPPVPDDPSSPLLDAIESIFVGEPNGNATFGGST